MTAKNANQLITEYVDMARRVAHSMSRSVPTHKRDDLESAALLGLTEAASRFDPERGEEFGAFAIRRIRGAVLDELRRSDFLTRRARAMARAVTQTAREVEHKLGRAPTNDEIAAELGVASHAVAHARQCEAARLVPLDSCEYRTAGRNLDPIERIERREQVEQLMVALGRISSREREVVELYYREGLKLREIGARLGVTESRVCQLRSQALRSLKRALASAVPANESATAIDHRPRPSRRSPAGRTAY